MGLKTKYLESENLRLEKIVKNKTRGVVCGSGGYMAGKTKPSEEESQKLVKKVAVSTGRAVIAKSKPPIETK